MTGLGLARGRQNVGRGDVGHAEVEHFRLARFLDQDVAGLEVAMNDALVVGVLHGIADLGQKLEACGQIEIAAAGVLVQGHSANKLHREKRPAVDSSARLIHLGDPGVLKPAQDLCFVAEAIEVLG